MRRAAMIITLGSVLVWALLAIIAMFVIHRTGQIFLPYGLAERVLLLVVAALGAVDDLVQGPEVTVRVAFDYPCSVPVARHIVCALNPRSRALDDAVWRFEHSSTLLVQDAPYEYRSAMEG